MAYPAGAVRLTAANDTWQPAFLHKDHLGSVRAISGTDGTPEERTLYRPYGAQSEVVTATLNDDKSWLGERYDAGAGLQYLNARYYDPELAMFLQPDWFEVMQAGVGTNRYGYSFGDPVNLSDPGGNEIIDEDFTDKERDRLADAAEDARDRLDTQERNAREIERRLREGDTSPMSHSESATYLRMIEDAGGGDKVTANYADRVADRAHEMREHLGNPDEGVKIVKGVGYEAPGGGAATGYHNDGFITVYGSYFTDKNGRERDNSGGYIIAHEMGHEALGLTDRLPGAAKSEVNRNPADVVVHNSGILGYRAVGADLARKYGKKDHNDRFICTLGFKC
jgi:RHS repeat-associated protein